MQKLKKWARQLKTYLVAIHIALKENLVPWYVKILIVSTLGYALSPIDLIPDFIPILGILDDLIILPMLIWLILKLTPRPIMEYCREQAIKHPISLKKNWFVAVLILIFWGVLLYLFYRKFDFPSKYIQ